MQKGDCFGNGYMLSHLYFISAGTTVKNLDKVFKMC